MKRHGVGLQFESNGQTFKGSWKDDKKNGLGTTYVNSKGKIIYSLEATWQDDELKTSEKVIYTNLDRKGEMTMGVIKIEIQTPIKVISEGQLIGPYIQKDINGNITFGNSSPGVNYQVLLKPDGDIECGTVVGND
eukprot:GHVP01046951.1.p1 GENE.GHVP01046951.1~~GHVP01046951.1.p1  ORF type:complete len:135 (+),score=16.37 GHVP01046951.1:2-406(+)